MLRTILPRVCPPCTASRASRAWSRGSTFSTSTRSRPPDTSAATASRRSRFTEALKTSAVIPVAGSIWGGGYAMNAPRPPGRMPFRASWPVSPPEPPKRATTAPGSAHDQCRGLLETGPAGLERRHLRIHSDVLGEASCREPRRGEHLVTGGEAGFGSCLLDDAGNFEARNQGHGRGAEHSAHDLPVPG